MNKASIDIKKKLMFIMIVFTALLLLLIGRIFYIQAFKGEELQKLAYEQQTRDRLIAPVRGIIYDRNMVPIVTNETVASVSVINSQIKQPDAVAKILSEKLELDYTKTLEKVNKKVALVRIKIKVDKDIADNIRKLDLDGVVVDEDIKRIYPFKSMASQVIGFVGKDNQGIIGLEARYDKILKGESGKILTETDVRGLEIADGVETRISPIDGNNLVLTIDTNLQQYAEQSLEKAVKAHNAERGIIIMMNPQNGEILAMANKPDFDLNKPFTINNEELEKVWDSLNQKEQNDKLNNMWRNFAINDSYEPGSTFKIVTSAAGMEEGQLTLDTQFTCTGSKVVGGIQIKCWRHPRNHGVQDFAKGIQNSCNPVFMTIAEDLGAETFYKYMNIFELNKKTGIDLPGEATGIMHKLENVGSVELATMSFGQSFQITPLQLLKSVSATINGGHLITPHFGKKIIDSYKEEAVDLEYKKSDPIISKKVSDDMKEVLESVVSTGTGNKTYIPGYRVGGKTATSEKLPRRNGKYISSFLTFAPANNPQIITLVLIDEPKGIYYGGQVAGPTMKEVLDNSLPYLNVDLDYSEEELATPELTEVELLNFVGMKISEAKKEIKKINLVIEVIGEGDIVIKQFPEEGEFINYGSKVIIYTK